MGSDTGQALGTPQQQPGSSHLPRAVVVRSPGTIALSNNELLGHGQEPSPWCEDVARVVLASNPSI